MHSLAYGLPRIHLLGPWVNKGMKKGRGVLPQAPPARNCLLRNERVGLPTLFGPLPEDSPGCLYGGHRLGIYPASVVKLRTKQRVELLRSVDVHQEEASPLAGEEPRFSDLARLHDPLQLRPEPLVAQGPDFGQDDVLVNLEGDVEQHFSGSSLLGSEERVSTSPPPPNVID